MTRFIRLLKISFILVLALWLGTQPGYAQSPITASVDSDTTSIYGLVTLTVEINSDSSVPPDVNVPIFDKFNSLSNSRSWQTTTTNGVLRTTFTYTYLLQPTEVGSLEIGPFEVELNGQTYTTDPIAIEVGDNPNPQSSNATGPPEADFFVEAEIDNASPYVGEQVIYTHRFYSSISLFTDPFYDLPRFTGFWSEEDPVVTDRVHRVAGRRYNVHEVKIVLFPTRAGPLTIDESVISSPGGVLNEGFSLITDPIDIDVKPLPTEAPDGFGGAVGLFTLEVETSATEGRVNEPITLLVTLTGRGNISTAPDPDWPELPEWRVFDAQSSTITEFQAGNLIGRRIYERLMVPGSAGKFTIPPIVYSYFDPGAGEYRTVSSDPIDIQVEVGTGEASAPLVIGTNKEEIERVGTDIRHIKPVPTMLTTTSTSLTDQSSYWLIWAIPLVLLAGNFVWARRQQFWQNNRGLARSARAYRDARKSLEVARRQKADPYRAAAQILTVYLTNKLNEPVAGMTKTTLAEQLQSRGIDAELIKQVDRCLADSDLGRFTPDGALAASSNRILDEVETVITKLEKAFTP